MNKIEKSELLLALYAKQEEAREYVKNAQTEIALMRAIGFKHAINAIIQMVTDDF